MGFSHFWGKSEKKFPYLNLGLVDLGGISAPPTTPFQKGGREKGVLANVEFDEDFSSMHTLLDHCIPMAKSLEILVEKSCKNSFFGRCELFLCQCGSENWQRGSSSSTSPVASAILRRLTHARDGGGGDGGDDDDDDGGGGRVRCYRRVRALVSTVTTGEFLLPGPSTAPAAITPPPPPPPPPPPLSQGRARPPSSPM